MGERLVDARTQTFNDSWPHENRKGWKCKTKKLVEAGWCYDPSPEYDDGVRCFYCDLSLDGWEPKDDPLNEHRRRSPQCHFFLLSDEFASSRAPKGKKARGSHASKASRFSTQSNVTTLSEAPTMTSQGDGPAGEDDSILTAVTNTTSLTQPKARKRSKAAAKGTRKASRAKKAPPADASVVEPSSTVQTEEAPMPQEPPKRMTRRVASRAEPPPPDPATVETQQAKPSKGKGKGKAQPRLSEDESQLHSELQAAIDASIASSSTPRAEVKPARGVKRTSDGKAKLESSVVVLEDPPAAVVEEKPKAKRGKKAKQAQADSQRSSDALDAPSEQTAPTKAVPKGKKGKKTAKQAVSEPEPESQKDEDGDVRMEIPETRQDDMVEPATRDTPNPTTEDPSPAPSSPTPAKAPRSSVPKLRSTPAKPLSAPVDQKAPTPDGSPQSSDAENKPPSSRPPPSARQPIRIPLAATTPNASPSPSKRQPLGKITGALPWDPTDLETIFLFSPVKAAYAPSTSDGEKENALLGEMDLDGMGRDKAALRLAVARVKRVMSDEERGMSVEEWVRWNARRGEEGLRARCEEMVMRFEREGGRAMRVLEGI